jgi:hypothetical protein
VSTPTCRTCGAKFPGKEVCTHCGANPNAEPSTTARVKLAIKQAPKARTAADRRKLKHQLKSIQSRPRKRKHGR